jgi:hypothetical protein
LVDIYSKNSFNVHFMPLWLMEFLIITITKLWPDEGIK